ncbi:tRNA-dihydrouridine(16 17) synthase [NAD(P)(+)]-like isoform X1, partial [Brachionus plicatilis]
PPVHSLNKPSAEPNTKLAEGTCVICFGALTDAASLVSVKFGHVFCEICLYTYIRALDRNRRQADSFCSPTEFNCPSLDISNTPMMNAGVFVRDSTYRAENFVTCPKDRPLIAQFCSDDPELFTKAAEMIQDKCDAVDLNLRCPQNIARRGHYGAFLKDEWEPIHKILSNAVENLKIPVTAKIRVFDDIGKTVEYAKMVASTGIAILTVHGRTREQKGPNTGLASWEYIRAVKANPKETHVFIAAKFAKKFGFKHITNQTMSRLFNPQYIKKLLHSEDADSSFKNLKECQHPELERCLFIWFNQAQSDIIINDKMLMEKAQEFGQMLGINEQVFKYSIGWVTNFKRTSSCNSERAFSKYKIVLDEKLQNMTEETVKMNNYLYFNYTEDSGNLTEKEDETRLDDDIIPLENDLDLEN